MGRYVTVALAIPRATPTDGRYVSLRIGPYIGPIVTVTTASMPGGRTGTVYSLTFAATGGASPYTWSVVTGTLPAGLTLTGDTVAGTPTESGTFALTIRADDATVAGLGGPYSDTADYTLLIGEPPFRGLMTAVGASWTRQLVLVETVQGRWDQVATHSATITSGWARTATVDRILAAHWGQIPALATPARLAWDRMPWIGETVGSDWTHGTATDASIGATWDAQRAIGALIDAQFNSPPAVDADALLMPWQMHAAVSRAIDGGWHSPPYKYRDLLLPWEQGYAAPWRIVPPIEPPPPPPPDPPTDGRYVSLRFACPRRTESTRYLSLPLGPWQCYAGRLSPKVIIVTDSVNIVRVGDNAPIAASAISIRGDLDSPMWQCSVSVCDAASLALLVPGPSGEPRQIRATINGHVWVFLIENFTEAMRFGSRQRTATGRSITALLSRDYLPVTTRTQTSDRDAQQLADEAVAGTGYTVDWGGPTWLVPGGTWSYVDQAPLDALRSIAESCGCVLQSHQTDAEVIIAPAFTAPPWRWAITSPDVDIIDDYLLERSIGSAQGVRGNFVEVRGETSAGIRGEVKITGTAGDEPLPQVTHPLITAAAAAEARGIYELSKIGPIGKVGVEFHLFGPSTAPGLVLPGMLVRLSGTLMTRAVAVSVSASWTDAGLYVRQSVELERHYDA